jgi:phosphonate transport system ATP-binding protein
VGVAADFALEGVYVDFPNVRALEGIDLEIASGEAVGFVGPSGSGKSSLLGLLNGQARPSRGRVLVGGRALGDHSRSELKAFRSRIGFVHQHLSLIPNLRVSQNVMAGRLGQLGFAASLRSLAFPSSDALEEVHALLERVGIPEKLFVRVERLSLGQQQRVAIARALYQEPVAMIADEPVSSLDPARARDTVALLARLSREQGITLCMSLHNLELAREFVPRLVGLRSGRVVFDAPSDAITDEQFAALYTLGPEELWRDGA